jgi:hypothetical protein
VVFGEDAPKTRPGLRRLAGCVLKAGAQGAMNAHPHDHEGQLGTVYILSTELMANLGLRPLKSR